MSIDLAAVSTADLLAEVDRRTRAAAPPSVFFYGVWPGERAGHYLRDRYGNTCRDEPRLGRRLWPYPWDCWRGDRRPQDEGLFWHYHAQGKTVLVSWDRSADSRGGCCATFLINALATPAHALELARDAFPGVFQRIEQHIGRSPTLAGPAEDIT